MQLKYQPVVTMLMNAECFRQYRNPPCYTITSLVKIASLISAGKIQFMEGLHTQLTKKQMLQVKASIPPTSKWTLVISNKSKQGSSDLASNRWNSLNTVNNKWSSLSGAKDRHQSQMNVPLPSLKGKTVTLCHSSINLRIPRDVVIAGLTQQSKTC